MENKDGIIKVEYLSREALERAFALACRQLHKVVNATSEQVSLRAIKQEVLNQAVQQMTENRRSPYEQKPEAAQAAEEDERMNKFTKSDLRDGDVVMYDNGEMRTVKGTSLFDCFEPASDLSYYSEHLIHERTKDLDIVEVYRSIWEREEPTITTDEKIILRNVDSKYKYIARAIDGYLYVYYEEPKKGEHRWLSSNRIGCLKIFNNLFHMVKWEDEEPWLIEDLLNLPVKKNVT